MRARSRAVIVAPLVDRLREARTRVRLGLPLTEDLDELLDDALRELESAGEDIDALAAMASGGFAGRTVIDDIQEWRA